MKMMMNTVLAAALMGSIATAAVASNEAVNQPVVNQAAFAKTMTVQQALGMKDDSKVQLKGYVVKAVGDEKYQFRDSTGSITVEIDDELWQGKPISAKTPVTIIGEVDIDYKPAKRVEIDVEQLRF
ncbi:MULTISPECIES: NirD/YgiW/YdeI family stress tolerance protein [Acinetobacter]|uniref:TIGR00156 family protein n=1 Tax=Acinetobacter pseudolwoffii TaxID=2053287 RepID=N9MAC4_9GAMM|nr:MULTISPECIES: NirD/YgiW/YdeI family stress tolerance protein [Acinetobacter]NLZ86311.1 NirD/YgiW/YdeI family stress tolerance protein [Gammaproteobacteria bacterium]ENW87596.1 TIGR00156 family protein [Acinetobacter pseudolwoffii]MCO8091957.1 NirD/YgiW/YdeI family stress tolerance protein [Acinetobacter pseudolwoffii]MCP0912425.1 NirD/YgiW/YdeI family stress tolerance protein [Acinetobacter pseudolwoffii]MDM1343037.1 NirD/YgiW/YdeI family stress tolerance protein [Acinetobacter pseudolwoffi